MESHLKGLVKIRAIGLPSPERLPRKVLSARRPPNNQRKQRRLTVKQLAANSKGIARSKAPSKDLTKPTASGSRIKDWVCPTGANLDLALQVEARRLDTLAASEAPKTPWSTSPREEPLKAPCSSTRIRVLTEQKQKVEKNGRQFYQKRHTKRSRMVSPKGLSCLAQLLVIGPGAIFSQPTARDLCPQWKTSMLLEFGAIAVETQTKNFLEPSGPIWSPFGNTRLHIIKTFAQMGFGHDTPIDWTLLLETFQENFSLSSFGSRYLG
ncbi:hypothetical protein Pst134EB_029992 [Puccinia striiformis f. sp. tritici]|nr:hypothetical protein Pst134EB_029992 [Puccinia striiformis f. sp. tritici]